VIEDSDHGVAAARGAGMRTFKYRCDPHPPPSAAEMARLIGLR